MRHEQLHVAGRIAGRTNRQSGHESKPLIPRSKGFWGQSFILGSPVAPRQEARAHE